MTSVLDLPLLRTAPRRAPSLIRRGWSWLIACRQRRRQRLALAELEEHLLNDIGLTRRDVAVEVGKPFWKP